MKSWIGPGGALAYTAVLVVGIMTILLLFPLGLAVLVPSARLTDNWTVLGVAASGLGMFLAGIGVAALVRAAALVSEVFRQEAAILWGRRFLEFLLLVAWYYLFIRPLTVAVGAAIAASVFVALTEPQLDRLLAEQKRDEALR